MRIITAVAFAAAATMATAVYADQRDVMRQKLAAGDHTPPSGYEIDGRETWRDMSTGQRVRNPLDTKDPALFWRMNRTGDPSATAGPGQSK